MGVQISEVVSTLSFRAMFLVSAKKLRFELSVLVRFSGVRVEMRNTVYLKNKSKLRNVKVSSKQASYFKFFLEEICRVIILFAYFGKTISYN